MSGRTSRLPAQSSDQPFFGRRIVSYSWDFGDPNDRTPGSGPQTQHRYAVAGGYNVTLTVTDDLGRTSSLAQTVDVK